MHTCVLYYIYMLNLRGGAHKVDKEERATPLSILLFLFRSSSREILRRVNAEICQDCNLPLDKYSVKFTEAMLKFEVADIRFCKKSCEEVY